jgi:hypothetical protein
MSVLGYIDLHVGRVFVWGGGFKEISVSEPAVSGVSEASTTNAFGSWLPDCPIQVKPGHTACKMDQWTKFLKHRGNSNPNTPL